MNKFRRITLLLSRLTILGLCAAMQPAVATPEIECREEADYYGISPEQRDEYIDGCLASRGGESYIPEISAEDYMPPPEVDVDTEGEEAGANEAQ